MDLIGEERGRLARAASWLEATPVELTGLVVLLVCALAATGVVVWSALGRPTLAATGTDAPAGADAARVGTGAGPVDPSSPAAGGAGQPDGDADDAHAGHDATGAELSPDGEVAPGEVTVHVAGAVADPGVLTLPAGARVADAVEAAGGLLADADPSRINLARPLEDGEQLLVLREGEEAPPPVAGTGGGTGTPTSGPVDLNRASAEQLRTLPGIGPALAERIVAHREQHGPFGVPGDLRDVSGIGEKRFQDLADLVTVG